MGLVLAIGTGAYLLQQRDVALRDAEREVRNLSLVLATSVERGFRAIELMQTGILEWLHAEGMDLPETYADRANSLAVQAALHGRMAALQQVASVFLTDDAGRLIVGTKAPWPTPSLSHAERDFFRAIADVPGRESYLSSPSRNTFDGVWNIYVSRRISARDGRFLGVLGATVALDNFERYFGGVALGPDSSISLSRSDGLLLVRHPRIEEAVGTSTAQSAAFRQPLPNGGSGVATEMSPLDGKLRIKSARALEGYPLVIQATRAVEAVLEPWHREARRLGLLILLLEGLILGGVLLANRHDRQRATLQRLRQAQAESEARLALSQERERAARALAEREAAFGAVFETGTAGVAELDLASNRFVRVNQRFCEITGRTESELLGGLDSGDLDHPEDRAEAAVRLRAAVAAGHGYDMEKRYLRPDGTIAWVRISAAVSARDAAGRPLRSVGIVLDITESREAAERLRASEALLRMGMEVGRIGTFERDLATGAFRCGPETRAIFGWPVEEPISTATWLDSMLLEDRECMATRVREAIASRAEGLTSEYRLHGGSDGSPRHLEVRARYTYDAEEHPVSAIGVVIDITERREAEQRLRESEARLRLVMQVGRIGSFRHDVANDLFHCDTAARSMFGLPPGEEPVPAESWLAAVLPEDLEGLQAEVGAAWARCEPEYVISHRLRGVAEGEVRHVEARIRTDYDAEGRPVHAIGAVIDVTERREAEARIAHIAHHDALTDLPNRTLFRERLEEALARARRGTGCALLYLDLDHFKEVNDTLGHPVGDALLKAVTARLLDSVRETDTIARLGGDEFAIIQVDAEQPTAATTLAKRLVEVLSAPFELDGHQVVVGTSIGIAMVPGDGEDADTLLKNADMALYRAKAEGRGRWRFFEPEMDARMQLRRALETDLRRALAAGEFELHYQPIMDVASRRVSGLEALIRWRHPERGLVPPDAFIPLAEEIGLIVPLGEWVLAQACRDAAGWLGTPKVAVNLSPVQFASRGLVDAVATALELSGLDPARLELEITETVMLQDTQATLATLHRLKALGVRIAMDDFGTGYSSLSYLQRFPFDKVKIDRSFTSGLEQSPQSNAIVGAVTDLCLGLAMTTTAEGVETEEQLLSLLRKGCQEAQGYLFSRPCPAGEVPGLLDRLEREAKIETAAE
ncbi:bifunctional diguanylate cyclase/phosphodiesterase [Paracraurococcus lichenis]|uniref:EAL domain-containing protein n=1 Tax=Paracraurococcus lichenis TaxID=3064888 RepID=A0ABT9ECG2_9PROT|nr:EAL domain-containing protein [Paracraurococcus sp. LOR1-02]MDO9713905.1 EAL domain-containing protein [Paracraurococcus sp. LOR1-02]